MYNHQDKEDQSTIPVWLEIMETEMENYNPNRNPTEAYTVHETLVHHHVGQRPRIKYEHQDTCGS